MNDLMPPAVRPANPRFSPGPTTKHPGWSLDSLQDAAFGRSHRSDVGKAKLAEVIERSRDLLGLPDGYRLGILPASDTGAFEAALWSLLGPRGVDVLAWDAFGRMWGVDVTLQLGVADSRVISAEFGHLPDLSQVDFSRDVVFAWSGTTSGVAVPDGDWIPEDRRGLTICDATSAAFGMELPWDKLDAVTYSWQKVMGGEAQHGMLALSPRAVERLESHVPSWPMPKIFRLTSGGKLNEGVFRGENINTPSLLCVEDALQSLKWAQSVGGLSALIGRTRANFQAVARWVEKTGWVDFLCVDAAYRSPTACCLKFADPWAVGLSAGGQKALASSMLAALAEKGVAYDMEAYREAPPGLRVWGGATVETADLEALFPWLDWAYAQAKAEFTAEAGED